MYNVSQWGTADAEIKFPSVENQELTNVLLLKPGKGAIFWTNIVASSFRVRFKCCFLGWGRGGGGETLQHLCRLVGVLYPHSFGAVN